MQKLKRIFIAEPYDPETDERTRAMERATARERDRTEDLIASRLVMGPKDTRGEPYGTRS